VKGIAAHIGVSVPTAQRAIDALGALGIVREITGRKRDRLFVYSAYLDLLNEGLEPL
jgi:Fic family protein